MHVHVDNVYITINQFSNEKLDELEINMSAEFDALERAIGEQGTVIDGVILLLDQLAAAREDPAKLNALLNEVSTKRAALAAAVLRDTPAAAVEQSTPTPDAATTPGMTTGNNVGGGGTASGQPAEQVSSPESPSGTQSTPGNTSATPGFQPAPGTSDVPSGSNP